EREGGGAQLLPPRLDARGEVELRRSDQRGRPRGRPQIDDGDAERGDLVPVAADVAEPHALAARLPRRPVRRRRGDAEANGEGRAGGGAGAGGAQLSRPAGGGWALGAGAGARAGGAPGPPPSPSAGRRDPPLGAGDGPPRPRAAPRRSASSSRRGGGRGARA